MTNKSPIFPIHEPHHFSDYGFDPQIDYFQVLEEARNHKREHPSSSSSRSAIDSLHFKLQKPNSKDESSKKIKKSRKRWWWKNALLFFKRRRAPSASAAAADDCPPSYVYGGGGGGVRALAESRSGASTPYHHHRSSASRPSSGPLAGTFNIPYISLTELNIDPTRKISGSPMPIYLVT